MKRGTRKTWWSYRPAVPNLFGPCDWFHGRQFFLGWGVGGNGRQSSGSHVSEASLSGPPLTSCCAAWFLTGHRPVSSFAFLICYYKKSSMCISRENNVQNSSLNFSNYTLMTDFVSSLCTSTLNCFEANL